MIDLTPLDVRNKKGDFAKALRGYDSGEVDTFLDLVAERLEALVRENMTLRERSDRLIEQVSSQEGREKAVQEALVTAQELREEFRSQAQRQADLIRQEAEGEARRIVLDAEREVKERRDALEELERKRLRFLRTFRSLLERELDIVEVEEGREPLEDVEVELELGGGRVLSRGISEDRGEEPGQGGSAATETDDPEGGIPEAAGEEDVEVDGPEEWSPDEEAAPPPLDAPVHELAAGRGGSGSPVADPDAGTEEAGDSGDEGGSGEEEAGERDPGDHEDLWLSSILQEEEKDGRRE